jgi:imidazolonepropionase
VSPPPPGKSADLVLHGASEVATPDAAGGRVLRIPKGAVAFRDDRILELGPGDELLRRHAGARLLDAGGRLVTPALVDCHTHMLFAGQRAAEFQRRLAGESYAAIAAAGGGIRATVRATAVESDAALERSLASRLERWCAAGVTTVEVKSGYGLTPEAERRLLGVLARVAERAPLRVCRTALLLHALPDEWRDRRGAYVEAMSALLPEIGEGRLASAADAYCDEVAFGVEECRPFLRRAQALGLGVRLHAEQLSRTGGAALAAELGALSADHLESANEDDLRALAAAGVVGVLLPAAALTLGQRLPRASVFSAAGLRVAIATDFNPGTAPAESLLGCAALAARLGGFTAEESLLALTWNAAKALGCEARVGHFSPGAHADAVVWECAELEELTYWLPATRARAVLVGGRPVHTTTAGGGEPS